jgi:transposase-like protein
MKLLNPAVARVLKRLHYLLDVMLMCVRWYVAYGLSVRNLEEMMAERGIQVDHSTVHRAIKRRTRPMLGFKTFRCARILLGGIELMHMIVKGQMQNSGSGQTPAEQFYSLAK